MESNPVNPTENPVCGRCGTFEVMELAGTFLCTDCIALAGCGCTDHGNSDEG